MKNKQILLSALFTMLFSAFFFSDSKAQCNVPAYIPVFGHEFRVNDLSEVEIYPNSENGVNRPYYAPKCGANPIRLRYSTSNHANRTLQMYIELWKQSFDCNGNLIGAQTFVLSTPAVEYGGNTDEIHLYLDINVEVNTTYQIKARRRLKTFGIYGSYHHQWSNNLRFIASSNLPTPDGHFDDELSVESRSGYNGWTVDVHQLDVNSALDFDASATTCESNWRYYIKEFNLATWTGSANYSSPLINGQAGVIDLDGVYPPGLQKGKLYLLTVVAGAGWYPENYWFEIKDAEIGGSISNNGSVVESVGVLGGGFRYYQLFERCQYNAMILNTQGTESADQYKISVQPVSGVYSPTGPAATTGWQSGPVASSYNINSVFGMSFALGQRYKLTYEVRNPQQTKVFYFRYKTCVAIGIGDDKRTGRLKAPSNTDAVEEASIYPNPTNGQFFLEIKQEDDVVKNVEVLDLLGKTVVARQVIQNNKMSIDLSGQENGIYLIRIISDGKSSIQKVIKQ